MLRIVKICVKKEKQKRTKKSKITPITNDQKHVIIKVEWEPKDIIEI